MQLNKCTSMSLKYLWQILLLTNTVIYSIYLIFFYRLRINNDNFLSYNSLTHVNQIRFSNSKRHEKICTFQLLLCIRLLFPVISVRFHFLLQVVLILNEITSIGGPWMVDGPGLGGLTPLKFYLLYLEVATPSPPK